MEKTTFLVGAEDQPHKAKPHNYFSRRFAIKNQQQWLWKITGSSLRIHLETTYYQSQKI
jgi:hypothetical protein